MKNGMKRTLAAIALCAAIMASLLCVLTACTDPKTDGLIVAAKVNGVATTRLLIEAGADVNAKNDKGETALTVA